MAKRIGWLTESIPRRGHEGEGGVGAGRKLVGTQVHAGLVRAQATWNYRYGDDRGTHVIDRHPSLEGDPCPSGGVLSPSGRGVEHLRQRAGKRFHLVHSLLPRATTTPFCPCILDMPMHSRPNQPPSPPHPVPMLCVQDVRTSGCQGTIQLAMPCSALAAAAALLLPPPPRCACCWGWVIHSNRLHGGGLPSCSSPASLTPILLSPPSPGCPRRGAGKQSTTWPAGRTSACAPRTGRTSWQASQCHPRGNCIYCTSQTSAPALLI